MKESGLNWPLITEDEQNYQMQRNKAIIRFYASFDIQAIRKSSVQQQCIDDHPEKELFAWVITRCREWLRGIRPEESDKYVLQVAVNLVNCIAFVPIIST
jgi:hypothetical protein